MHLDERRESRITHHIKAIEALTEMGVVALVFVNKKDRLSLGLTMQLEGNEKQATLLNIIDLCVGVAMGEVGSRPT